MLIAAALPTWLFIKSHARFTYYAVEHYIKTFAIFSLSNIPSNAHLSHIRGRLIVQLFLPSTEAQSRRQYRQDFHSRHKIKDSKHRLLPLFGNQVLLIIMLSGLNRAMLGNWNICRRPKSTQIAHGEGHRNSHLGGHDDEASVPAQESDHKYERTTNLKDVISAPHHTVKSQNTRGTHLPFAISMPYHTAASKP